MKSIYTYICIHIDIMKQRFIIIVSIIVSLLFVMMSFSGNFDNNRNIINNENPSNNYVRIGNITFMNNFTYQIME